MKLEDVILRDTRANQPAAGDVAIGTLYYVTDELLTERSTGATWEDVSDGGAESAIGPGTSTDHAIARWDGSGGRTLQNTSAVTVSDAGAFTFPDNVRQTFNPGADAAGINVGAIAGDPGTPSDGDLWYDSTANELTARINGANVALGAGGGGGGSGFTPPDDGDFSWDNQETATVIASNDQILLTGPAGAGDDFRVRYKTAPSVPYVVTVNLEPLTGDQNSTNGATYGVGFRQSSDGKLALLLLRQNSAGNIVSLKMTDPTTFSATYSSVAQSTLNLNHFPIVWFRMEDDNANRILSWSADGFNWVAFHSVGRTDFLTADQLCFFVNANASGGAGTAPTSVRLRSWLEE